MLTTSQRQRRGRRRGGRPPREVVVVVRGSASSRKRPHRPSLSDDNVVNIGGCGGRENDDVFPPSAFPIPASGGNVGGNVGSSGNNNNSDTNGTNSNKSVRRRRKMYSVESTYYVLFLTNSFPT